MVGSLGVLFGQILRSNLVEQGNAAATANNIRASEPLVCSGIALGLNPQNR